MKYSEDCANAKYIYIYILNTIFQNVMLTKHFAIQLWYTTSASFDRAPLMVVAPRIHIYITLCKYFKDTEQQNREHNVMSV